MKELDVFGRLIMTRLRDEAISFADGLLRKHWKAPALRKLQRDLQKLSPSEADVVRRAVRAAVDTGVHSLLFALQESIDSGQIEIRIKGKNVAEMTDGLHGELFSPRGWQAKFSEHGEAPTDA